MYNIYMKMILGFLFLTQTFLKYCKALSTEKYRRHINIYYYYYYYYYIIIIIIIIIIIFKTSIDASMF